MTHTNLLMRRLAYAPWLLAVGLVLGWSGEAVANSPDPLPTGHSTVPDHRHATDPYLKVTHKLSTVDATKDTIFVSWSTSFSKNFGTDTKDRGDGTEVTSYELALYGGESPADPSTASDSDRLDTIDGSANRNNAESLHTFSGARINVRTATLILDLEPNKGFYWVRMSVQVQDGNKDSGALSDKEHFAKQFTVNPEYILSVNPSSMREDAGPTDIAVTVKVSDDTAVTEDTSVPLQLGLNQTGLNERFRIEFPTLTIQEGQKSAEGTIRFTPIDSDTTPDDDLLVTIKTPGDRGGSTDIRLIDTDKESTAIDLSFSDATLTKNDGATDIEVTATLNGKTLADHVSFALTIDSEFAGSALRDVDYSATLSTLTIRRRQVSGKATITIRPNNEGIGYIRVAPSDATTSTDTIPVNPGSIEITSGPEKALKGLTAAPFSVREDAGSKNITLEVSLQNALLTDERVVFTIADNDSDIDALKDDRFDEADDADRDVDYQAQVQPLIIPRGEIKGTTTMTVTPINNRREDGLRAFVVTATIAGKSFSTGILITDDDTTSDSITLEVSPAEIRESDGATAVAVTGTLNGKVFKDNVLVSLVIDENADINGDGKVDADDKLATRDLDYTAILSPLVIPGGSTTGTTTITIAPTPNDGKEGDENIRVESSGDPTAQADDGVDEKLSVTGATISLKDVHEDDTQTTPLDPTRPTFAAADTVAAQLYTMGTEITPLELPAASGGATPLLYSVSTLPAGLAFDAATRTISGTPTAETDGAATIIYTVIDNARSASVLIFTIAVEEGELPPPVAEGQLTVTPAEIREDASATQVSLTVTLPTARTAAETLTFTIVPPSEGEQAIRDVDYTASLSRAIVAIPVGATVGTTTLTLTPINNATADSLRAIGVQARFSSGATLTTDIRIVDDETPSTAISLSANPHTIVEGSGETEITVTATLNGKALAETATVIVAIDATSTAARDVDYAALLNPLIVIPAGSREGSTQLVIRVVSDELAEGNETIKLIGAINGLMGAEVDITLSDPATVPTDPDEPSEPDGSALAFAANTAIPNQAYTADKAIEPLVLPAAVGGTPPLLYSISALPAGLVFDAATRTLTGTPTVPTDSAAIVIYTVIDSGGGVAALTFTIKVNEGLSFDDFFSFFGSGKIVPTHSNDLAAIGEFVVGQRVEGLVLPAAAGGTAPLTYHLSPALPAGLVFDAATRTIAGVPQATGATAYTYVVTDANGATASLVLQTLPTAFSLADNFPNPFNPATTIQYALPQAADVELTVYNVLGQPVRTLVAEHQSAGRYVVEWDATNDSGHSLSAGMYFYRLQAGEEFREVKKMLLLK